MNYASARRTLPRWLRRYVYSFEAMIEDSVTGFARSLAAGARILDAGAGEGQYADYFRNQRYTGVDLGVGDAAWNYASLDAIADLSELPFADGTFDAALSIVTLEHLLDPLRSLAEIRRVLAPGGRLLMVAPMEWEVHQAPHDYFRFTRYGLEHLLKSAGFTNIEITPSGGIFRLLSRRLLNALQILPGLLKVLGAIFLVPPALLFPLLDPLDRRHDFTLGYQCTAQRP
jgi:SAM-dependent methyltransferase